MQLCYTAGTRYHFLARIAFLLLVLSIVQVDVRSQVATAYSVLPSAGTYSAISGGTILFGGALEFGTIGDDISGAQTIAPFNFGGTTYTQIFVSANGFITFGSAPAGTNYTPISSGAGYAGAISAFGTNLQNTNADFTLSTQQRSVRIQTVGSEVVVQWRGMRRQGVNNENFNFQIRLNTATNVIKMVYGPIAGQTNAVTNQPEVGLRGPTNSFSTDVKNLQVVSAETWATPANGTTAASTMRFTTQAPAKAFTNGLTYTFTPCSGPSVSVTPPSITVCQGLGVTLTASGAASYSWSPASGLSATTGASVTATSGSTTTYTVTGTNPGCPFSGMATASIAVNAAPVVSATSGATAICENGSTTVSATASAPVSATSSASSGALSIGLPGTSVALATHALAITGGNGNIGSDITISMTLNATTANAQNDNLDFYLIGPANCGAMEISTDNGGSGDNYAGALLRTPSAFTTISTLGNTSNISASFSPEGNINIPANAASALIGSYTLPAAALAGCPVNGNWTIAVGNDNAIFPATFTGWSLTIQKTVAGNFTHVVSGPGTVSAVAHTGNNNSTGTVTVSNVPVGLQAYSIITTSPVNGCTTTTGVSVTVDPLPTVSITPDGPIGFCAPGSVGLSCNANPNYIWSPGGATTQSITASSSGSYTVAVTAGACTVVSAPVSVTAQSAPVLSTPTAQPAAFCAGGTAVLSTSASFSYCASTHLAGCGNGNEIILVQLANLSSASGCSGGDYSDYTATSASLIAGNGPYTLNVTMGINATQYAAAWLDLNNDGDFNDAGEFLTALTPGNAGVNGIASFQVDPQVTDAPVMRLRVIGGNNSALFASQSCGFSSSTVGETEDYTVYNQGGSTAAGISYSWAPSAELVDASTSSPVYGGASTQTFTVTATTSLNCATTGTVSVAVEQHPVAGVGASVSRCINEGVFNLRNLLTGSPMTGGLWTGPSPLGNADLGQFTPGICMSGTYTYTVSPTVCADPAATAQVMVSVVDLPNAGTGNSSTVLCYNDPAASLFALLPGTPDQTGTWSPPLSNAGGHLGNFIPGTDAPTTYTYTVDPTTPCLGAASQSVLVGLSTIDADNDGILDCDDTCIGVVGTVGSTCNFTPGNGYTLGQINSSCNCVQIANCAPLFISISTDNSATDETTYQILDNSETVVCSATIPAFANPITAPYTDCCLPPTGCYRLRVTESGGDGMVVGNPGGYQLREGGAGGKRIIDNAANFGDQVSSAPDVSALMTNLDDGRFCLPVGSNKPVFQHCDKLDWANDHLVALVATEDPLVSASWSSSAPPSDKGYEFWWFDPNGTYSFRRFRSHATSDGYSPANATRACKVKINGWANTPTSPWLTVGKLYNVRIRARYGASNYSPFGPACLFKIDPAAATCPLVKLQDNPANLTDYSCGVTRYFGGGASAGINMNSAQPGSAVNWGNKIVATPPQPIPAVASANVRYQFRFVNDGEYPAPGSCIIRPPQTNPTIYLNWATGDKLKCGIDYSVDVRVSLDNGVTWCVGGNTTTPSITQYPKTYWGPVCTVSIRMNNNAPCPVNGFISNGSNLALTTNGGSLTMYPNPNRGDQLYISLSEVAADVRTVNVDIYDMTGKKVSARTIAVQDGYVKTALDLNGDLTGGMYIVNIIAGEKTYTERLVIQP